MDELFGPIKARESIWASDKHDIDKGKKAHSFRFGSDEWGDTNFYNFEIFIKPSKLKAKDAQKELENGKNAAETENNGDSEMSRIQNFCLDLDEHQDVVRDVPMSLIDAQQIMYMDGCKKKNVIPTRAVTELTECTQSLDVSYSNLGPKGAKALAIPLHLNSTVSTLNLEDNDIGPDGCQSICEGLLDNHSVERLNLARNNIGLHGLICICRVLKNDLIISRLNLSGNGFGDTSAQLLAFVLQHPSIRELQLAANELEHQTAKAIGDNLGNNAVLDTLDLSRNHFRHQGAVAIAKGIKENSTLVTLDISYNGFGSEGLIAMAAALASNKTLQKLDISHNRITDEGISALCSSLNINGSLLHLKIGGNVLTMPSAMAFLTMINTSTSSQLVSLDLEGVFVEQEFLDLLKEIKQTKPLFITRGYVCYLNLTEPQKAVYPKA